MHSLRLCTSYIGDEGSVPGWETKIPHATWCDKKIEKKIFFKKNQIVLRQYVRHANTNLDIFLVHICIHLCWAFILGRRVSACSILYTQSKSFKSSFLPEMDMEQQTGSK